MGYHPEKLIDRGDQDFKVKVLSYLCEMSRRLMEIKLCKLRAWSERNLKNCWDESIKVPGNWIASVHIPHIGKMHFPTQSTHAPESDTDKIIDKVLKLLVLVQTAPGLNWIDMSNKGQPWMLVHNDSGITVSKNVQDMISKLVSKRSSIIRTSSI